MKQENIVRDWSCVNNNNDKYDLRYKYTRKQWEEQLKAWSDEDVDDFSELSDDAFMEHVVNTIGVEILETTHLFVGNIVFFKDKDTLVKIEDIVVKDNKIEDIVVEDFFHTIYHTNYHSLYGCTDAICPKCNKSLYISDVVGYPYVCLDCDENFMGIEVIENNAPKKEEMKDYWKQYREITDNCMEDIVLLFKKNNVNMVVFDANSEDYNPLILPLYDKNGDIWNEEVQSIFIDRWDKIYVECECGIFSVKNDTPRESWIFIYETLFAFFNKEN